MTKQEAQYYKALSNPVRLAVFMHVVDHSEGYAPKSKQTTCVSEISQTLKIPQPTVSNHLKVLEEVGLIKSVKVDTHSYQYVKKEAAKEMLACAQYIFEMAHKNPY